MKSAVVDASVAGVLPSANEPYSKHALALLDRYTSKEIQTTEDARIGLLKITNCNFPTVPSFSLLNRAFAIATTFGRNFYDCLYVALAESSETELITAAEKLVNALALHCPLKWLGAI